MDKREQFKIDLQEMLNEDETMTNGLENEIIYKIDNITVYGGYDMGIRGVDHAALLMDDISWEDIIEWGTLVVPETETYISDQPILEFEMLGFQKLPVNDNHIITPQAIEREDVPFEKLDTSIGQLPPSSKDKKSLNNRIDHFLEMKNEKPGRLQETKDLFR